MKSNLRKTELSKKEHRKFWTRLKNCFTIFGGVKRPKDGGKGLEGVCVKDEGYFNPFIPLMLGGAE